MTLLKAVAPLAPCRRRSLAVLYLVLLVRRRAYAGPSRDPAKIGLLAPQRPRWRRNMAAAVILAALALAVVGLAARPAPSGSPARRQR